MAKMRWSKLEWQRKARTHEPLADPNLSVPTERERRAQQLKKKKKRKKARVKGIGTSGAIDGTGGRRRQRKSTAGRRESGASFHVATLKAVRRIAREQETTDPDVVARQLGISPSRAADYLAEIARRGPSRSELPPADGDR